MDDDWNEEDLDELEADLTSEGFEEVEGDLEDWQEFKCYHNQCGGIVRKLKPGFLWTSELARCEKCGKEGKMDAETYTGDEGQEEVLTVRIMRIRAMRMQGGDWKDVSHIPEDSLIVVNLGDEIPVLGIQ
ncbi:MAG TPA: hypothetical protein VFD58_05745 [Blastocatellia bacterium]|nr:hypothetical protein [Blastocatellia bacterium]